GDCSAAGDRFGAMLMLKPGDSGASSTGDGAAEGDGAAFGRAGRTGDGNRRFARSGRPRDKVIAGENEVLRTAILHPTAKGNVLIVIVRVVLNTNGDGILIGEEQLAIGVENKPACAEAGVRHAGGAIAADHKV